MMCQDIGHACRFQREEPIGSPVCGWQNALPSTSVPYETCVGSTDEAALQYSFYAYAHADLGMGLCSALSLESQLAAHIMNVLHL